MCIFASPVQSLKKSIFNRKVIPKIIRNSYSQMLNTIMKIKLMILLTLLKYSLIIFIIHVKNNYKQFIIMERINILQQLNPSSILKCM